MARIVTYTFIMAGLAMLLYLSGIQTAAFSSMLIGMGITMGSSGVSVSVLAPIIAAGLLIFILGTATGTISVGIFTRQTTESGLIAGFASLLAGAMIIDFFSIISYFFAVAPAAIAWIIALIFVPMTVAYVISIIQWWRGSDI